jgi:flavin reductase (DIM6/NTAB) family NADH-FMN oxidoreductase RutF/uncharacterized protein YciI
MSSSRVPISPDKHAWQPSLIPGVIALVSSVDAQGTPNLAPKSFVQMVSFEPPILMFSGQPEGATEANILATGCFGLSLVHGGLAERAFACIQWQGADRLERCGFSLEPASSIAAPLVAESRAWMECELHDSQRVGGALVVYGRIVAASVRPEILALPPRQRYPALDLSLFLEDGLYSSVERARPAIPEEPGPDSTRWVYLLSHAKPELFSPALVREHVAHLARLEDQGLLELCGPFGEGKGGMVILRGVDRARAQAIMEADPFVSSGCEHAELREWSLSSRDNRHMGMG